MKNQKTQDINYKDILNFINSKEEWDMIVIDGVVGCGKTTLMELLEKEMKCKSYLEPVVNNPILDKFYYDRKRYSFPLQIFFLNNRFRQIKEASTIENTVMDRSIYGDAIFAKLLKDNDEMEEEEFNIYIDLLHNMLEHTAKPKLMVYLECSVDTAIERIKTRGRDFEQIVEREYWERLNKEYRDYFSQYDISPVLKINVDNLDIANNEEDKKYVLSLIQEKLKSLE